MQFYYHEEFKKEGLEEVEFEIRVKGSFNLNNVVATLKSEDSMEIFLDLVYLQKVPIDAKYKMVKGQQVFDGYKFSDRMMPMGITLTVKSDIERFIALTKGD